MTWNTDLFFKTTYVSVFLRFRSIICCFQCFVCGSSPFGKVVCHETPPTPRKLLPLNPLSPSVFPMVFTGGYGYFLEPHNQRKHDSNNQALCLSLVTHNFCSPLRRCYPRQLFEEFNLSRNMILWQPCEEHCEKWPRSHLYEEVVLKS